MQTPRAEPELDTVQRWFQAVITHPDGVAGGVQGEEAKRLVSLGDLGLAKIISPSLNLSAEERLSIYANAYYARLLECLADAFPTVARVLGAEVFQGFAFEYLQRYPSRSYTLDHLGDDFVRFLDETRPHDEEDDLPGEVDPRPSWPDFLIDLTRLDWAIAKVFDAPGVEGETVVSVEDLAALGPERFAAARLELVPCLRLLVFRFPVNAHWSALREVPEGEGEELPPPPEPAAEYVALSRTDFVVRRYGLTATQHALLHALAEGASVAEAVESAAQGFTASDDELAAEIEESFRRFATQGFFRRLLD